MLEQKILFVGGTFDSEKGKKSKIADHFSQAINQSGNVSSLNGGTFKELELIIDQVKNYDQIYWFANVDNNQPKLVKEIKKKNPSCILITSKRNLDSHYSLADLIYHALANKSNLLVELVSRDGRYLGRVLDPLGNVFQDYTLDFDRLAKVLVNRVKNLSNYTRLGSKQIGPALEIPYKLDFFTFQRWCGRLCHCAAFNF